jgi:ATP-dependent RNA helicase RhlE
VRALVLVPTRELAAQVGEVIRSLAQHLPQRPKVAVVFGGVSINPQMMGLRGGADVVVATPGRLLDLVDHNALKLRREPCWCWTKPTACWTWALPTSSTACWPAAAATANLLFSATFPTAVQALAGALLRDPVRMEVADTPDHTPLPSCNA